MCDLRKRARPQAPTPCLANGGTQVLRLAVPVRGRVAGGAEGGVRASVHAPAPWPFTGQRRLRCGRGGQGPGA